MRGSGLMLPYKNTKSIDIIKNYILNSNVKFLAKGLSGYIFLLELPDDFILNNNSTIFYKNLSPDNKYGTNVTKLLIKLQFITKNGDTIKINNIRPISKYDFQNEVNVQTDIYFKTLQYLQPLCPAIVYANIMENNTENVDMLANLNNRFIGSNEEKIYLQKFISNIDKYDIGIIAMEFVYNGITLSKYLDSNISKVEEEKAKNIARFAVLELALKTGYNHGDFHMGNLMLLENTSYFLLENDNFEQFSPMIIDFGRTTKIEPDMTMTISEKKEKPPTFLNFINKNVFKKSNFKTEYIKISILNKIRESVSNKNYREALSYLCNPISSNVFVSDLRNIDYFNWICGDYNLKNAADIGTYKYEMYSKHDVFVRDTQYNLQSLQLPYTVDIELDNLYQSRERAIDYIINQMDQLHKKEPIKYPLLPISNQIKNQLYSGMFGGKNKKKTYKKKKRKSNKTLRLY